MQTLRGVYQEVQKMVFPAGGNDLSVSGVWAVCFAGDLDAPGHEPGEKNNYYCGIGCCFRFDRDGNGQVGEEPYRLLQSNVQSLDDDEIFPFCKGGKKD